MLEKRKTQNKYNGKDNCLSVREHPKIAVKSNPASQHKIKKQRKGRRKKKVKRRDKNIKTRLKGE